MDVLSSPIVAVLILVAVAIIAIGVVVKRYRIAGPNEAIIVTGSKGKERRDATTGEIARDLTGQKVVMGAGVFVVPFVKKAFSVDLSARRIPLQIRGAVSAQGIKLNLEGVAIVKVGGTEDAIRAAAQRFLGQQSNIDTFTQETLSGSLRSIVGGLTVEQIIRDRAAFATKVAEESESSLTGQGLVLDTFQIQDITDDGTYLSDLGRPEQARITQQASIAEAEAYRASEAARISTEQQIADSQRELTLRKAAIKAETDAAQAQADASGPLAQADRQQAVLTEQEKVAERQAALTERQLDTEVRKPADAARYKVEQEALARRSATVADAEADAEQARLSGQAELDRRTALAKAEAIEGERRGEAEKARRVAVAQAVQAEGEAQAAAIAATGSAEAEAMQKKATAFASYNEAATLQMLIEVLPKVAHEIAAPMSSIDKLTVISTEGAAALPKTVSNNLLQTLQLVKDTTGFDLEGLLGGLDSNAAAKPAAGAVVKASKPATNGTTSA